MIITNFSMDNPETWIMVRAAMYAFGQNLERRPADALPEIKLIVSGVEVDFLKFARKFEDEYVKQLATESRKLANELELTRLSMEEL